MGKNEEAEANEEYKKLLKSAGFPSIYVISQLAAKYGIKDVPPFWEFFDKFQKDWNNRRGR